MAWDVVGERHGASRQPRMRAQSIRRWLARFRSVLLQTHLGLHRREAVS